MVNFPTRTLSSGSLFVLLLTVAFVAFAANPASKDYDLRVKKANKIEEKLDVKDLLPYAKNWTEKHPDEVLAWYYLGHAYELQGQTENALNAEHKALRLAGQNHVLEGRIWAMIGETYGNADMHEKSMSAALRAMRYKKALISAGAWYSLGLTYGLFGLHSKEVDAYTQALGQSPQSALVWFNLTGAYLELHEISRAIGAGKRAVKIAPNSGRAWLNLGITYGNAGEPSKAVNAFQHAVNIDPANRTAREGLRLARFQSSMGMGNNEAGPISNARPSSSAGPVLEFISVTCEIGSYQDFININGEVKNLGHKPYTPKITAKFNAASGTFVKSDYGFTQYQPLMPGQTSPFSFNTQFNPEIASMDLGAVDESQNAPDYDGALPTTGQKHVACN